MDLTSSQLGIEGTSAVIFEMDGQTFSFAGQTEDAEFSIKVAGADDGDSGMLGIILIVLAVLVLLAVGAFFFIEFEEVPDEDDLTSDDSGAEDEDPYAWAKAKAERLLSHFHRNTGGPGSARLLLQRLLLLSIPGWLWDQATNQWVPDPNYQPEQ